MCLIRRNLDGAISRVNDRWVVILSPLTEKRLYLEIPRILVSIRLIGHLGPEGVCGVQRPAGGGVTCPTANGWVFYLVWIRE